MKKSTKGPLKKPAKPTKYGTTIKDVFEAIVDMAGEVKSLSERMFNIEERMDNNRLLLDDEGKLATGRHQIGDGDLVEFPYKKKTFDGQVRQIDYGSGTARVRCFALKKVVVVDIDDLNCIQTADELEKLESEEEDIDDAEEDLDECDDEDFDDEEDDKLDDCERYVIAAEGKKPNKGFYNHFFLKGFERTMSNFRGENWCSNPIWTSDPDEAAFSEEQAFDCHQVLGQMNDLYNTKDGDWFYGLNETNHSRPKIYKITRERVNDRWDVELVKTKSKKKGK